MAVPGVLPYLIHPRMISKWVGFIAASGLAIAFPIPGSWIWVALGAAVFFVSEYVVHRSVYHHLAGRPAGRYLSANHVAHHGEPESLRYLFNDPRFSVTLGVVYFVVAFAVSRNLGLAAAFSAGNFLGLVYYEWVHFAAHRAGARPWTPWGRWMKKLHLLHHYKNEHFWFGVTSPALDVTLGTWRDPETVDHSPTVRTLVPPKGEEWLDRE